VIHAAVGRTIQAADPDVLDLGDEPIPPGGIGREAAMRIVKHLSRKPVASPRSCVLLPAADRLTPEAANALLVTLEEPPAHALIILTATNPAAVLPTVRSRCVPVQFAVVPEQELTAGLAALVAGGSLQATPDQLAAAIALAAGRPGRAVRYLREPEVAKQLASIHTDLQAWQQQALPTRLKLAAAYGVDRDRAQLFLHEADLTLPLSWRRGLVDARRRLARNVQPRAVLEAFAMLVP
jgi:DNA polymerase-3 subunit delta'